MILDREKLNRGGGNIFPDHAHIICSTNLILLFLGEILFTIGINKIIFSILVSQSGHKKQNKNQQRNRNTNEWRRCIWINIKKISFVRTIKYYFHYNKIAILVPIFFLVSYFPIVSKFRITFIYSFRISIIVLSV